MVESDRGKPKIRSQDIDRDFFMSELRPGYCTHRRGVIHAASAALVGKKDEKQDQDER